MIYLDNAATTFPKPESVYDEMDKVNRTLAINAGRGTYKAAQAVTKIIDETREKLRLLFHAEGLADMCFTPSVTHAINQVLNGIPLNPSSVVYITPYEHNAVARTVHLLQKKIGFALEFIPLQEDLQIDLEKTAFLFSQKKPSLVVVNKISNVTGYVLPVEEIFALAKHHDAVTVMDAAQAAGLVDINMRFNHSDIVCFAGHKTLYGPFGVGGFAIKKGVLLEPVLTGGTGSDSLNPEMPDGIPSKYEASSPNIVAIAGLLASLNELDQEKHQKHSSEMTKYLLDKLKTLKKVNLMGAYEAGSTLGIVSFSVTGYASPDVGTILNDEFDIAVRTGYHCAPYIHKHLKDENIGGTVRVGLGLFSTKKDIDNLMIALKSL